MTRRVLVIDDEVLFGNFVARVCASLGFEVLITTRPVDFQRTYTRFDPDVIVLDIIMPEMDGLELIQWLAKQDCTARIVLVTGFNPHYATLAEQLGKAHGQLKTLTLMKPMSVETLKAALMPETEA